MKLVTKTDKRSNLEKEYDNAVLLLKTVSPGTDAYDEQLDKVERLHKMLMDEKSKADRVSKDAVVGLIGQMLSIGAILQHERLHNIVSKALQFVPKGRLR